MISFIYFDVGGVVIKDFSASNKWAELQKDLGINSANQTQFDQIWHQYRNRICIDFDVDNLLPILRSEMNLAIPDNYSLLQDFINRFERNESIWKVVENVKTSCRIGLLTNMYPRMFETINNAGLFPPTKWDVIVDSSIEKCQKPDKKIFEIAEQKANVPVDQILFVENSSMHLEAAKKYGWQTFFYDSSNYEQSTKQLAEYIKNEIGNQK